jgi:hypothetical protein
VEPQRTGVVRRVRRHHRRDYGSAGHQDRRALLRAQLRKAPSALIYSEHLEAKHGEAMFCHACAMGLEGI